MSTQTLHQLSTDELKQQIAVERITPAKAKQFLAQMGPQRNPRQYKIKQYAEDMQHGRWAFNGAPLIFDTLGRFRDGQNRMMALVMANVTLPFVIIRNASEETLATVDTGMSRTFADVNKMQGINNATDIAAACAWWWKYEHKQCMSQNRGTHRELVEIRTIHLPALIEGTKLVRAAKNAKVLVPKSVLTFFVSYLYERDPDAAQEFLISLDTGLGLTNTDPLYSVRRNLTNYLGKRVRQHSYVVLATLIKAFNLRYKGEQKQNVVYRSDEKFPEFVI